MSRYFSTSPVFSAPVSFIDREQGIIRGITIAKLGLAKGHNGFIDRTFLVQVVENAATKTAGIKARFGHPNMCSSALGTYLGRFKNYSYSNDKVNADLYLDSTARSTPGGDLYTYVLDMAEQNPDMFGASIVFEIAESVFLEEEVEGKKVQKEYFRLKELRATDIVDEPAATDGLFSVKLGGAEAFPAIATRFLDENPEILDLVFSKPDSLVEFLSNYISNSKMNLSEKIKQNFAAFLSNFSASNSLPLGEGQGGVSSLGEGQGGVSSPGEGQDEVLQLNADLQKLLDEHQSLSSDHQALIEQFTELQTNFQSLTDELQSVRSELETRNQEIETQRQQLSARPSIPLNVTDPALSLSTTQEKDETGKQVLSQLPKDLKRKLANSSKTTE